MFNRKCPGCGEKVEKKFNYCPYCGLGFKQKRDQDAFGFLGKDDVVDTNNMVSETKLPFGFNKIIGSLMKQLQKEMANMDGGDVQGMPKNFQIKFTQGQPVVRKVEQRQQERNVEQIQIPDEELERRRGLKRVEAESKVRRLGDRIVYELSMPGVKSKKDIILTRLEEGIEIRAYSKDKCYYKAIPLKVEILGAYVKDDSVFVEFKG